MEQGLQIVGIKKVKAKSGDKVYTTYSCQKNYTNYDLEHYETYGVDVEQVQTIENWPISIGDTVVFYYDKARGDFQPAVAYKMVEKNPHASDKK